MKSFYLFYLLKSWKKFSTTRNSLFYILHTLVKHIVYHHYYSTGERWRMKWTYYFVLLVAQLLFITTLCIIKRSSYEFSLLEQKQNTSVLYYKSMSVYHTTYCIVILVVLSIQCYYFIHFTVQAVNLCTYLMHCRIIIVLKEQRYII